MILSVRKLLLLIIPLILVILTGIISFLFLANKSPQKAHAQTGQLAFPTAEGFGRFAIGGRGGYVCHVTNLNNDTTGALLGGGPHRGGSYRYCIGQPAGKTIVFHVAGTITIPEIVQELNGNVTVAGQTAPGEVLIRGAWNRFHGDENIVRHMRFRPGDPGPERAHSWGGLQFGGNNKSIGDHISISWVADDSFLSFHATNVTLQWSIVAEGLRVDSIDPQGNPSITRGKCLNFQGTSVLTSTSVLHSACINQDDRSPQGVYHKFQVNNNIFYNGFPSRITPHDGSSLSEFRYNWFKDGPVELSGIQEVGANAGCPGPGCVTQAEADGTLIHYFGNYHPVLRPNDTFPQDAIVRNTLQGSPRLPWTATRPAAFVGTTPFENTDVQQSATDVLNKAGARVPVFSAVDARLIKNVIDRTGSINPSSPPAPGYPTIPVVTRTLSTYDSDYDGMPNTWEDNCGLDKNNEDDGAQFAPNGYTNLENFLNKLAGDTIPQGDCGGLAGGNTPAPTPTPTTAPGVSSPILKTATPPVIDGTLSEYQAATPLLMSGGNGNTTDLRMLWDNTHLYIGATITDTELNAAVNTHDTSGIWSDDSLEFVFDTLNNGGWDTNDYKIIVNAQGATYDLTNNTDLSWNGPYTKAVSLNGTLNDGVNDTSWNVEIALPWSSVNLTPAAGAIYGMNFQTNDKDATRTTYTWNGVVNTIADARDVTLSSTVVNAPSGPTACHSLDNTQSVPSGYAASYNPFTTQKELLLSATCNATNTTVTLGNGNMGDPTTWDGRMWVWNQGYELLNNTWQATTYACSGEELPVQGGSWCRATATGTLDAQATGSCTRALLIMSRDLSRAV